MISLTRICYVLLGAILCIDCQSTSNERRPTVRLSQGNIIGTKVFGADGKTAADAFFGIPYAAPPLAALRFAPPQRHGGWNGTLQATAYGPRCPQLPLRDGDEAWKEDCLYLNIWAHENAIRYGPLPVVIYLEGVEFDKTNEIPVPGQDLAAEGAVVVTINYRLNVFGFLCLGTQEMRGNFGLIDQYFAMIWVKENIQYFGGDAQQITLFGNAAGAASVSFHLLSPRTTGLFQRAIISSGSALSPWYLVPDNQQMFAASQKFIRILGCWIEQNPKATLKCLQMKSTRAILKAYEEYLELGHFPHLYLPVVDAFLPETDRYLPLDPSIAFKEGAYAQMPILTGTTKLVSDPQLREWTDLASQGFVQLHQFVMQSKVFELMSKYQLSNNTNKEEIVELIKWRYADASQGDARVLLHQLQRLDFEAKIDVPHLNQVNQLMVRANAPIYVYYLDDIGFVNLNNSGDYALTSDILLLFGPLLLNQIGRRRFNANEMRFSKRLKQLWINFIRFGNPTPNNNMKLWRRHMANDYYVEYFESMQQQQNGDDDKIHNYRKVSFWSELLPMLSRANFHHPNREMHSSPDPAAGFRHAMYTLVGLVVALLALLLVCVILLKRRTNENVLHGHIHMEY